MAISISVLIMRRRNIGKNKIVLILTLGALLCISLANRRCIDQPMLTAIEKVIRFWDRMAEDNLFNPSGTLSRAEAAEWIVKTFKLSAFIHGQRRRGTKERNSFIRPDSV
jgi:hypothetical protein